MARFGTPIEMVPKSDLRRQLDRDPQASARLREAALKGALNGTRIELNGRTYVVSSTPPTAKQSR